MAGVFVVPVYVEVPSGFERAIATLESHLRRAGYAFYTGDPLPVTLEETRGTTATRDAVKANSGQVGT